MTRRIAFLLLFAASAGAFAQPVPMDENAFTNYAAQRLRKHAGSTPVAIKAPLTLSLGELTLNLDRVHAFCQRNPQGCEAEIDRYTQGSVQALKDRSAPPTRAAVRLVVRPETYARSAQAAVQDIQPRPLVEGLVVLPVLDAPRTLRMLTLRDNDKLGLDAEQAYQLGLANLKAQLKPLMDVAKPARQGQIGRLEGDIYHPSRLIAHGDWAPLAQAQGGTLVVAAPANDTVLYVGEASSTAIDALRALVREVRGRAPNPLSDMLLRWTPGGWELLR